MSDTETYNQSGYECPHCNHVHVPEEAHHYDEDTADTECDSCGEPFTMSCYVSYSWTCDKVDADEK